MYTDRAPNGLKIYVPYEYYVTAGACQWQIRDDSYFWVFSPSAAHNY